MGGSGREVGVTVRWVADAERWVVEAERWVAEAVLGTDPDRNRVTWETPSSEAIPFRRKPLRRTRLLCDPAQTQV